MAIISIGDVSFRYVQVSDAAYILQLRSMGIRKQALSPGASSIRDQEQWLQSYKEREQQGIEHYFIILHQDRPVGAVRVYSIDRSNGTFTWGSWVIQEGTKPEIAWLSVILIYDFAFVHLELAQAQFQVVSTNQNVIRFHRGFGAQQTEEGNGSIGFVLPKASYARIRDTFLQRFWRRPAPAA
ncbi:MAG: GNAT family N-acetyltransferase [Verrucomicrobiota bacterium]